MRLPILPLVAACSVMSLTGLTSMEGAQTARPSSPYLALPFTDAQYGYSLRVPPSWKPYAGRQPAQTTARLSLGTPTNSSLLISVSRLPRRITRGTDLAVVGETYVDPIVNAYFKVFDLMSIADQKADWSDAGSMRLWQGTSATHSGIPGTVLLSLHAIRYGSDTMINIVYVSGANSALEVRQVDIAMKSLAFVPK
jgi:hypothetical protein